MATFRNGKTHKWRFEFLKDKKRVAKYGFRTRAEAKEAEGLQRRYERTHRDVYSTFGDLIDDYTAISERTKSAHHVKQVRSILKKGFGHLAELPLTDLRRGHLETALNSLVGVKASTVNSYRRMAKALLNHAVKMQALSADENPARYIEARPEPAPSVKPIPTAHLKALILAADPETKALVIFLSQTGARWIEAARLEWVDVIGPATVVLSTRKSKAGHERRRRVPMTDTARAAINSLRTNAVPFHVFASPQGKQLVYNSALYRLTQTCKRAGIPRYSFHQIRHWTGMVATQMGKSRKAVSEFLGQTSTSATDRYQHALDSELWEVAKRLEAEIDLPASRDAEVKG